VTKVALQGFDVRVVDGSSWASPRGVPTHATGSGRRGHGDETMIILPSELWISFALLYVLAVMLFGHCSCQVAVFRRWRRNIMHARVLVWGSSENR